MRSPLFRNLCLHIFVSHKTKISHKNIKAFCCRTLIYLVEKRKVKNMKLI